MGGAENNGYNTRLKLGQILVEQGVITQDQLKGALSESIIRGEKLGITLVRNDFCTEHEIAQALSKQSQYDVVDLKEIQFNYEPNIGEIKLMLEKEFILFKKEKTGSEVVFHIIISDPYDMQRRKDIQNRIVEKANRYKYYIAPATDLLLYLKGKFPHFGFNTNIKDLVNKLSGGQKTGKGRDFAGNEEELRYVSALFSELLEQAVYEGVDDVHIETIDEITRVKFKKGKVSELKYVFPMDIGVRLSNYIRNRAKMTGNIMSHADGAIRHRVINRFIDIRVSRVVVVPAGEGGTPEESLDMRILDRAKINIRLDKLGFHPTDVKYLKLLSKKKQGLIVFYGPTGSGKSTSLYALIKEISSYTNKIVTVEDPVEYRSPTITQVQVNEKAGVTFASTLRAFLRHAPDVILIGEIRDSETAQIALQAANTGHLVLTTIHATDADLVRDRLEKLGADVSIFDDVVLAIIGQRRELLFCDSCARRECADCLGDIPKYQIVYAIKDYMGEEVYCDTFEKCKAFKREQVLARHKDLKDRLQLKSGV